MSKSIYTPKEPPALVKVQPAGRLSTTVLSAPGGTQADVVLKGLETAQAGGPAQSSEICGSEDLLEVRTGIGFVRNALRLLPSVRPAVMTGAARRLREQAVVLSNFPVMALAVTLNIHSPVCFERKPGAYFAEGPRMVFWNQRHVFLTGHTGFKGSWLALWLHGLWLRAGSVDQALSLF